MNSCPRHTVLLGFLLAVLICAAAQLCIAQGTTFGPPVKVTPTGGFGYEPSFVADRFGNILPRRIRKTGSWFLLPIAIRRLTLAACPGTGFPAMQARAGRTFRA